MDYSEYIQADPEIMLGKPVIKGTRLTVEVILQKLSDGFSENDLIDMYPILSKKAIITAIGFASDFPGNMKK
ncbi:MAG: DUF433 domain-containing protein [Bacteroidota bacterium]